MARKLKVEDRIEWLGEVSEDEKRAQYASAMAVIYPPVDEDYGYVTLEAMLASKPVITCEDSGGPLEFVLDGRNGLVTAAEADALALAMDALWDDRVTARELGKAGRVIYESMNINWSNVVRKLLS
jgi:glycosyltransferase involved in cell wall biosynthesis